MTGDELPTQDDFDPWRGNPDASWAHGIFGGLTIPEAIKKFQERPDVYQEAFMFMGGKAFAYYFPVIENHLYAVPNLDFNHDDWQDPSAWIIAKGIEAQFDSRDNHNVFHLVDRVIVLANFVQDNIGRFEPYLYGESSAESVSDAWAAMAKTIQSLRNQPSPSTQS